MKRTSLDLGLAALRIGVGGTLAAHGAQKLFGLFGGHGIDGTSQGMAAMGFEPARTSALAAGLGESAGLLLVAGAATPLAGAAAAGTMIGAASVHAGSGFFATEGGLEYPAILGLAAGALALTGPGSFSVDAKLGYRLNRTWITTAALAAAIGAGAAVVARRQRTVAAKAKAAEAPATAGA